MQDKQFKNTIRKIYVFECLMTMHFVGGVLIPFFVDWGGITQFQVQLLQMWFAFWQLILEVPTGVIADRFGRKKSIALSALVLAFSTIIYGLIPNIYIFLLAEFSFALSMALLSGANTAMTYDLLKKAGRTHESKKIFSQVRSFGLLGIMISAPIGSLIGQRFGLNIPMVVTSIPAVLALIVVWSIKEPPQYDQVSEEKRYLMIAKKGLKFFLQHKQLRLVAIEMVLISALSYFVMWFYQPIILSLGVPLVHLGWYHAAILLAEIIVSFNYQYLERLVGGANRYFLISGLIVAIGYFIVSLNISLFITLIGVFGIAAFGLTRLKIMIAAINHLIPSAQRATINSFFSLLRRFFQIFLNPIIGWLAYKSYTLAFIVLSIMVLLIIIFSPLHTIKIEEKAKHEIS